MFYLKIVLNFEGLIEVEKVFRPISGNSTVHCCAEMTEVNEVHREGLKTEREVSKVLCTIRKEPTLSSRDRKTSILVALKFLLGKKCLRDLTV